MRTHKYTPASFSQDVIPSSAVDCHAIGFEPLMNAGDLMLRLGESKSLASMRWRTMLTDAGPNMRHS